MSRFIETVLIKEGNARNLAYHQNRINRTIGKFFGTRPFNLGQALLHSPKAGTYRCRLTYAKIIEKIEFIPYTFTKKSKLLAIESDLNYNYKFYDRTHLDSLLEKAVGSGFDDALIVKNGLVTDTTIANIAFYDGTKWITPALPLLRGTARARYLQSGMVTAENIPVETVGRFSHFALMNALTGFYIAGLTQNIER